MILQESELSAGTEDIQATALKPDLQERCACGADVSPVGATQESLWRLAAGIAHEINTPMQYIGDNLNFVRDTLAGGAGPGYRNRMLAALDSAIDGVSRVNHIVQSMRAFSHPRARMTLVNLNEVLMDTLTMAAHETAGIAIETRFGEIPPVFCYGGDISQAFLNLVVNAAQATEGSGRPGRIQVSTEAVADMAVIRVRDNGTGIPAVIRHRVFDPFFTTKEPGKGTGQGLAIAQALVVERHGGSLSFESEAGAGSCFEMRLPIHGNRPVSS